MPSKAYWQFFTVLLCVLNTCVAEDAPTGCTQSIPTAIPLPTEKGGCVQAQRLSSETVDSEASHNAHLKPIVSSRTLLQTEPVDNPDVSEFVCTIQTGLVNQLLDEDTGIWRIDDDALEAVRDDLQSIVNCTREGDALFFNVSRAVRPTSRVTIPWRLTISAVTENSELVDGVFPRMETKTTFRCPRQNEGVFLILARDVLLANIQFRRCVFDDPDAASAVVKVRRCRSGNVEGTVQLHHVSFRNNRLITGSGLRVNSPSCSAVEMVDVVFRHNECSEVCGAVLSSNNNTIRRIVIRQNSQIDNGNTRTIPSIIFAPPGSQTIAQEINARDNEGNVLRVRFGLLTLTNSSFSRNSADVSSRQDAFGACVHVMDSIADVEDTTFEDNTGDFGSAVYSDRSNLTLLRSDLERNSAIQGGAVYMTETSVGLFNSCTFFFNSAQDEGGAVYASQSDVIGIRESFLNNTAGKNGGALHLTSSSTIIVTRSAFIQNFAMNGGVVGLDDGSNGNFADSVFDKNSAEDSGGALFSDGSDLTVTKCNAFENNATGGGWISAVRSSLDVRHSECGGGFATSGGCIFSRFTDGQITNVTLTSSQAEVNGGALRVDRSNLTITDSTIQSNSAGLSGGGISSTESGLTVSNSAFINNTAETGGGGLYAGDRGFVDVVETFFEVNSAMHGAGMYVLANTTGNVTACRFERNVGRRSGGAMCIETAYVWIAQIQFFANNAAFGGAIYGTTGTQIRLADSVCINGTARIGGCLALAADSVVHVHNIVMEHNRATENGGALYSEDSQMLVTRCSLISNGAVNGGGIFAYNTQLECSDVVFDSSAARTNGGGMYVEDGAVRTTNALFISNSARYGGASMLLTNVDANFVDTNYTRNRASVSGAVSYVQEASLVLDNARFIANIARDGGCFVTFQAELNISNSDFVNGTATATGGFVYALENSTVRLEDVSMSRSNADRGGAIAIAGSYVRARRLRISQCKTQLDGGAIFGRGASRVHCSECVLEHNDAHGRGGAVHIQSNQTQGIAVQFVDCTFQDNRGEYGGGLYFVSTHGIIDCSEPRARCPYAALSGTVFRRNRALSAGGAIFTNDVNAVRIQCHSDQTTLGLSTTDLKELAAMNILNTLDNVCQNWTGNHAVVYGEMIASYATDMKKMVEFGGESVTVRGNHHFVEKHAAGTQLPTVILQVCDDLGQGPAIGSRNITTEATMTSPDDLFSGSIVVPLTGGSGSLTGLSLIRPPGRYEILVDFSEDSLETFHLMVEVRDCVIGEERTNNGASCQTCNAETFNFFPETSTCQQCPGNGNCLEDGVRPRKGYWNQNVCATHIQRCLKEDACDYDGRDERLAEFTTGLQSCEISTQSAEEYNEAQCSEGHTGPLCGSCKDSYGKSQTMKCEECFSTAVCIVVVAVTAVLLLALASCAVGSNVLHFSSTNNKVQKTNSQTQSPSSRSHSISIPQTEVQYGEQSSRPQTPQSRVHMSDQTVREAEMARWKAFELFKLILNFLQVTALAAAINVDWSKPLIVMFAVAEVASGVTCEATNRSVDCLISDDFAIPRSIIGHLIDGLLPLGVIGLFVVYWAIITIKNRQSVHFWAKRSMLSAIAVLFVAYTSITMTIISSLDCIEVHDSTSFLFDSTSHYWVVDTSLTCYDGSHAVLAGAFGWPFLVLFSFGFPLVMAYVIVKSTKDDCKEGCVYDVAGFMYRSYGSRYIFWESVIMIRKAALAVVLVFAYQLGTKQQIALAAFILILALYAQVMCQPFRQEFRVLNEMEGTSLLISLLTFLSSLLFKDEDINASVRIFVGVVICVCNVWLLVYFILFFFVFTAKYLKFVLDREGVRYDPKGNTRHILKVYLLDYLAGDIREESLKVVKRMVGRQRSCTCS